MHGTIRKAALFLGVFLALGSLGYILHGSALLAPSSGTWAPTPGVLSEARSGAAAAALSDGRVLVTGGDGAAGSPVASVEVFGLDGSFVPAAPMTFARARHVSVTLADGRVLVAGGVREDGTASNSAEVYDPASDSWQATDGMLAPRSGATATLLQDGKVLIAVGEDSGVVTMTLEVFDPASNSFLPAGVMSTARKDHAAALLADGKVFLAGGSDGTNPLASTEIWDPATDAVVPGPVMSVPRAGASATALLDSTVLIAGGSNGQADLATAEIFDAASETIVPAASALAAPRSGHKAVLLPHNASVLILGGTAPGVELYVPWADGFSPTGQPAVARDAAAVSPAADGMLMVAGGYSTTPDSPLPTAEVYGFATLKTDQADYPPGTQVLISGAGWEAGDSVNLTLHETGIPDPDPDIVLTVTADANGNIVENSFYTDIHDEGVRFYLTAVGTRSSAQTTFTDAPNNTTATVACVPASVAVNSPTTCTATVTNDSSAPNNGYPQGAVKFFFSGPGTAGSFSPSDTCTVAQIGSTTTSTCSVTLTPTTAVSGKVSGNYNATDSRWHNDNSADFNLTVYADSTPPDTSITSNPANPTNSTSASFSFTGTDNVTPAASLTFQCKLDLGAFAACTSPKTYSALAEGSHTFQVRAIDAAGNVDLSPASFTWTVDTTPPTIDAHGDVTAEATSASGATVTYTTPATHDAVDGDGVADCSPGSGTAFAFGDTTVTCNKTDAAGNAATPTSFVVHVVDTTAPVIAAHGDETAEATSSAGAVVNYTSPSTSDAVDGAGSATCAPASGSTFALGNTTVTCNATDAHGNHATATTFAVHVQDTTPPVIAAHLDVTEEATSAAGAVVTYASPTTSDAVDGAGTATCAPASGSTFALGNTTVTCNATDAHGNHATATTFTVHVQDTTPPVIAAHLDVTEEATSAAGALVSYSSPTTSDAVDGPGVATCLPASGGTFPLGDTAVDCNAVDAHGNHSIATTFTVHVVDTTPPVIAAHSDVTEEATGPSGAVVSYTSPATSDAVDGTGAATCAPASGSTFAVGDTIVDCNAVDAHGNHATATQFTVHVVDTTPPVLTLPADIVTEATSSAGAAVTFSATSLDLVDGSVPVICAPASGSTFPLDANTVVNCSATDAHHNEATGTFHVKVQDTTPPALTLPADIVAEATSSAGAAVTFSATSLDLVDGSVPVICTPASGSTFALDANSPVNCSATDAHHNEATGTFHVKVQDTTPPALTLPADIVAEATSSAGAAVTFSATSLDLVDGSVPVICAPASGSTFALDANTPVSCTATDAHHNEATGTFHVKVQDTTPPTISGTPSNMTLEATGPSGAVATWASLTATDLVDGSVAVACVPASGSTFAITTTTVTCTATDAHHNGAHTTFTVKVQDTTPPTVSCGTADGIWHAADVSIHCTASDIVGLHSSGDANFDLATSVPAGTETANASTDSRSVCDKSSNCTPAGPIGGNKIDKKPPQITITRPTGSYLLNQSATALYSCVDGGSGNGTCSGPVPSGNQFDTASVGSKSFAVTATDAVGNSATVTNTYTVQYASAGTVCMGDLGHTILQPIDWTGTSVFKQKSTVPTKFRVCDANGVSIGTPGVVLSYRVVGAFVGTVTTTYNEDPVSTTPDAAFRWSPTDQQWIFNTNTKGLSANVTYVYQIALNDGSFINFQWGLK